MYRFAALKIGRREGGALGLQYQSSPTREELTVYSYTMLHILFSADCNERVLLVGPGNCHLTVGLQPSKNLHREICIIKKLKGK